MQLFVIRGAVESGAPIPLVITDWASKNVFRVSRASLEVESQAGVIAVDALHISKLLEAERIHSG